MHPRAALSSLALAALALAVAPSQVAEGGSRAKPPPPSPTTPVPLDGGTIYYVERGVSNGAIHSIAPDGTNDTVVSGIDSAGGTRPSRQLHNGTRWFVTLREANGVPGFFPGGPSDGRLWELDVVPEGGTPVPLTDNAGSCINIWGDGVQYDWATDASGQIDGAISWLGARWEDTDNNGSCDQIVEGGIFRGEIDIDAAGNVTFSQPTQAEVGVALSGNSTLAASFAWAPDGQQVAYTHSSTRDLWVVNGAGQHSMIFNGRTFSLSWSPDLDLGTAGLQSRIAFTGAVSSPSGADSELGTYTILPNGTGRLRIGSAKLQKRSSDPFEFHFSVHWSPAGNQLIYVHRFSYSNPVTIIERLHRVNANATNNVVLLDTVGGIRPHALGWAVD